MTTTQPLSVIVPAFNEELTIRKLVERVLEQPFIGQVVIVDDGSSDGTFGIVQQILDPRVTIIQHEKNRGKGAAIRTALRYCTGVYVAIQDADMEYNPAELAELLKPLLAGDADVVFGSRFISRGERRALYFWHTVGNRVLTLLSNMASNVNLTDMETCYKVFRRDKLERLRIQENGFGIEPELTIKAALNHLRIYEVGISYYGRTYEEGKKIGWRDGIEAVRCIVQYSISERRRLKRLRSVVNQGTLPELHGSLEGLRGVTNYYEWIYHLATPFLGDSVLEVGAGVGTFTGSLIRPGREVVAVEPDADLFADLETACSESGNVRLINGTTSDDALRNHMPFDSAVLVNVLEHIDDDVAELVRLRSLVRPGGHVLVWVPSHEWLYSAFDSQIGHFRRYNRKSLQAVVEQSGLEVVDLRYVNPVGAIGWLATAKVLRRPPTARFAAESFDRFVVPWMRSMDERVELPFGQSLWLVARVPKLG